MTRMASAFDRQEGGVIDLRKAIHELEMLIEIEERANAEGSME